MSRPIYTALIVMEEVEPGFEFSYPPFTVEEFDNEEDAELFCRNFIKHPCAGGPKTYKMKWQVIFGVALNSGESSCTYG